MGNRSIISWTPITNTAYEPSRHTNWSVSRTGWQPLYDRFVWPAMEWLRAGGFEPRHQWHWPQGRGGEPQQPYDFDAWVEAIEEGQHGLVDDYIPMGLKAKRDGVELITYLDSLRADVDFHRLLDPSVGYGAIRYMDRFYRSVWPGMICGSLGFDNVTSMYSTDPKMILGPDHPGYHLLATVRHGLEGEGDGATCYVEATSRNCAPWWHDWNQLVVNSTFKARHVLPLHPGLHDKLDWWPIFKDGVWIERDAQGNEIREGVYTGEIVRLCQRPSHFVGGEITKESIIATYRNIAGDGHTMAFRVDIAMSLGLKAEELAG